MRCFEKNGFVVVCSLVATLFISHHANGQGSLVPPGAPAESMRSLTQVEPRVPISSLPLSIIESGSYYLESSLSSTGNGITVNANDVSIDLMGFTISGASVVGSKGIHVAGGDDVMLNNVRIRNGSIRMFEEGILVENTLGGRINDILSQDNSSVGIRIRGNTPGTCRGIVVEDCTAMNNGEFGIQIDASGGIANNKFHVVKNNYLSGNGSVGIRISVVQGCLIQGNHIGAQTSTNSYAVQDFLSQDNLIIGNSSVGNVNGFSTINSSSTRGPSVTTPGVLGAIGNENHPWANFHLQ